MFVARGHGKGLEGFIIFTRRYRSNPTILIPRREAIAHLKERPATRIPLLVYSLPEGSRRPYSFRPRAPRDVPSFCSARPSL